MRTRDKRVATLLSSRRNGVIVTRWELLKPGRDTLIEAVEVLRQLSAGVPDSEDLSRIASELLGVVREFSAPAASAGKAAGGTSRPQAADAALPRGDRIEVGAPAAEGGFCEFS